MRHTTAILWLFTPFAALALAASASAADTIDTIEGERYEGVKILKLEGDGVIVKHTRGIAKIPFYELDDATRRKLGHTGEVTPPVRHRQAPKSGLLGDIEGGEIDPADLDLDIDRSAVEEKQAVSVRQEQAKAKTAPATQPAKQVVKRRVEVRTTSVSTKPTVGVSAIGTGSWHHAQKIAPAHKRHRHGCGCGDFPTITTRYTPYGNFSYYGRPSHWYGYYNPPCNRCRFEKVDHRRWEGRR